MVIVRTVLLMKFTRVRVQLMIASCGRFKKSSCLTVPVLVLPQEISVFDGTRTSEQAKTVPVFHGRIDFTVTVQYVPTTTVTVYIVSYGKTVLPYNRKRFPVILCAAPTFAVCACVVQ